ncbi:hypothetical protein QF046_003116 [Microbacterium sp. W4I4]|uniref:hypothetical protein n=1 Tax=Microbacterium sp. W4I4 TaxID=3042295 RepID=UPI0027866D61|nr:hypothetical protein [Microbacterium sp. W4I4]MDQ0615475.1 hypothetical protein [Microbacterium sp. W4I4]
MASTTSGADLTSAIATVPRAVAIAQGWAALGAGVEVLSNGSGRPLARTIKLILDPLVIRPVQNPHLAGLSLTPDAASELVGRIADEGGALTATAQWFVALKSARRALRISDGNPQEKYFQRCFELARLHGVPTPATAERTAADTVQEIAQSSGENVMTRIRELVQDADEADRLHSEILAAWRSRGLPQNTTSDAAALVFDALNACGTEATPDLEALVATCAGSAAASALESPDAARVLGLTTLVRPGMPELGTTASKRSLPLPFDRSVYERLFAALSGSTAATDLDAAEVLADEIARTAQGWELADERSRAVMMLGAEAAHALEPVALLRPTNAHRLLRGRWDREAYVRRVRRLPADLSGVPEAIRADVHTVRQGYLRRLWVRMHGRELRDLPTPASELWDTLDGILRSVVMDQRHRLKLALARDTEGAA